MNKRVITGLIWVFLFGAIIMMVTGMNPGGQEPDELDYNTDFLAMVDTGRWIEHKGNDLEVLKSGFVPGKDRHEMLKEPELLQQMFFRELRACRIEPTGNEANVRWGVKDGTRDHATGRMLHDDLVMSAAMAVFEDGSLPLCNTQAAEAWAANYREIQRMLQAERDNWFRY